MRPILLPAALAALAPLTLAATVAAAQPAAEPAPAPAVAKTKVLVLPYQAIYRSVDQKKLDNATQLLFKELEQKDDLAITRGAVAASEAAKGPNLDGASAAVEAAQRAEEDRRISDAISEWKKAIAEFEKNAAAVSDASLYIEAHHRLARAEMMAGHDKEAKAAIDQAARMEPGRTLERGEYSRLYRRWFTEAAAAIAREQPGTITVGSALPGAKVSLDGREMEVAPVLLDKVVPGKHLVVAQVPDVNAWGAVVNVPPKGKVEVRATFSGTLGGSSVGRVTDAIAENAIPKNAVEAAASAGKEAGAPYVIFGGMAKDDDKFRVHSYLVEAKTAKIVPLESVSFDLELLTAETDVLRIANAAHDAITKFPPSAQAQVAQIERRIKAQSNVTKVDASPEYADAGAVRRPGAKQKGPRSVFKPLKGNIEIKDEKE